MKQQSEEEGHWTLDKRVPLALILTLAVQFFGFVYYMGTLSVRMTQLEIAVEKRDADAERLTRLEEKLSAIGNVLLRIETRMDKQEAARR